MMPRVKYFPLDSQEVSALRVHVHGLSGAAARQLIFGLVEILSSKDTITRVEFEKILCDAVKYTETLKRP